MCVEIKWSRIFISSAVSVMAFYIPFCIPTTYSNNQVFVQSGISVLLWAIAIPLCNPERVSTKKRYEAIIIAPVLLPLVLYGYLVLLYLIFSDLFNNETATYLSFMSGGILIIMLTSLFMKIENLRLSLVITGIVSLSIPLWIETVPITSFFFIYHGIIGACISLSIWIPKNEKAHP